MPDFVSLTCPSCGSRLQVTNDLERFACGFCGNELVVRRGGGIVSLAPVVEGLDRVAAGVAQMRSGVDRTATELAIQRLRQDSREVAQALVVVESEKSLGLGWGIAGITVGLVAMANNAMGFGIVALALGILFVLGYIGQQKTKMRKVHALQQRLDEISRELAYHELKLRS